MLQREWGVGEGEGCMCEGRPGQVVQGRAELIDVGVLRLLFPRGRALL